MSGRMIARTTKVSPIFHAAMNNDTQQIKESIKKLIDKPERLGRTPLIAAAIHGQLDCLELLLGHGANPDQRDNEGNNALHECSRCFVLQSMRLLLDYGANPNVPNVQGCTPLHVASYECSLEAVNILLEYGADSSIRNKKNETPAQVLQMYQEAKYYDSEIAAKIINRLKAPPGTIKGPTKGVKAAKEETMEGLKNINKGVDGMSREITGITSRVEKLQMELQENTKKLESVEERNKAFKEIFEAVKIPEEFITNCADAQRTIEKIMDMTSNVFDNLCHMNEFNERTFFRIYMKISDVVSTKPGLWKELARNLYKGYPSKFMHELMNEVEEMQSTEKNRVQECLAQWKVFVGTYVDKIKPLKEAIQNMDFERKDELCEEIDKIVEKHEEKNDEQPSGSLTPEGLTELAKKVANKWRDVGFLLDFTTTEIEKYDTSIPVKEDKCRKILKKWAKREKGFMKSKMGRLIEVLKRIGQLELADELTL